MRTAPSKVIAQDSQVLLDSVCRKALEQQPTPSQSNQKKALKRLKPFPALFLLINTGALIHGTPDYCTHPVGHYGVLQSVCFPSAFSDPNCSNSIDPCWSKKKSLPALYFPTPTVILHKIQKDNFAGPPGFLQSKKTRQQYRKEQS